ncbi:hypothetical protein GIB67_009115 [Kingdonia uniflora]|uniref:Gamma-tubulin complex component n=1 Tax=Kingdonia uniflora TaxID=39325 RepID=A0A7J7N2S9_9MAGN|nr:hypothetical protein GIB67_009115 [Kingdonia uniflora]
MIEGLGCPYQVWKELEVVSTTFRGTPRLSSEYWSADFEDDEFREEEFLESAHEMGESEGDNFLEERVESADVNSMIVMSSDMVDRVYEFVPASDDGIIGCMMSDCPEQMWKTCSSVTEEVVPKNDEVLIQWIWPSTGVEVLEPNWHLMHGRLQTAKSIDEVIQYHDFFLEKCLKECLLLLPELLKKVEKLKSICLQYAAATQWLISSSICIPEAEASPKLSQKSKPFKSKNKAQALKLTSESARAASDSVIQFEKEFNGELQSLGPILTNSSHAEPYLTHLAQWILGVGDDQ